MSAPPIEVEDLHVRYARASVEAVQGLSFSVAPGEIVGFLGPNGAGKSSTLKTLMGFVQPSAGLCSLFGKAAGTPESRQGVGYLPEVALYYPYLTPHETLTLYGEIQGLKGSALKKETEALLEAVGVSAAMRRQNRSLSKGMLQRVGIAQSLLGNPKLLILDEVTSGLDPVGRQELRMLLKKRRDEGATLFFSSHELAEVDMLCDRILLINKGRLIEERQMDMLKDELRDYTLTYSGDAVMLGLTDDWNQVSDRTRTARFRTKENLLKGIDKVNQSGGEILDIVAQEGSLENYFIAKVGGAS
ncbi:MAG: ABC transporter ATP-binding protein [Fimbriimonas sp.]